MFDGKQREGLRDSAMTGDFRLIPVIVREEKITAVKESCCCFTWEDIVGHGGESCPCKSRRTISP